MAIHSHSTEACSKSPGLNEGKLEGRASVSLGVAGRFSLGIVAGRGTTPIVAAALELPFGDGIRGDVPERARVVAVHPPPAPRLLRVPSLHDPLRARGVLPVAFR